MQRIVCLRKIKFAGHIIYMFLFLLFHLQRVKKKNTTWAMCCVSITKKKKISLLKWLCVLASVIILSLVFFLHSEYHLLNGFFTASFFFFSYNKCNWILIEIFLVYVFLLLIHYVIGECAGACRWLSRPVFFLHFSSFYFFFSLLKHF